MKENQYITDITIGRSLFDKYLLIPEQEKRGRYKTLEKYLAIKPIDKVCVLYGLKGTGKNTLLSQCISSMSDADIQKTAYIKATSDDTMRDVYNDLALLYKNGIRYVFIDEITSVRDFIISSAVLSDIYAAMGMKIVLSGTDSYSFCLAEKHELYARAYNIRTTHIPFEEYSKLLKKDGIDEYIRCGGTLYAEYSPFINDKSAKEYIETAVVDNLYNSLVCCDDRDRFKHLYSLYECGVLKDAVSRVIEGINYSLMFDVIEELDDKSMSERLTEALNRRMVEENVTGITDTQVKEIKEFLKEMDIISYVSVKTTTADMNSYDDIVFTQPGMRYCQSHALVHLLMKDSMFNEESEEVKKIVSGQILSEVKGRILKDIVLMETTKKLNPKQYMVFKLTTAGGKFDMVIYDRVKNVCGIYEIKHSDKIDENEYKNLADEEQCALVERIYGNIVSKTILYRGESFESENGIRYRNVEEYLKNTIYDFSLEQSQDDVSVQNGMDLM